ncbi:hypothetical protein PBRA_005972 [Plasmodiophora brassicae]|nr:hypothetical protein PBRA_005972 [Plasmodiophora brassicae]
MTTTVQRSTRSWPASQRESTSAPACTRDDAVLVLFGSQTGVALRIARQLCERLKAAGVSSNCCCLNQYKFFLSRRPRVVVIVSSTFLVGAAPLNAAKFNEFLDDPTPDDVSWMSFAVLGIGNSQWPSFCAFTRKIDARLQELGARRLVERLDGDSADEPKRDADIDDWIDQLVGIVVPRVTTSDIEEAKCPMVCAQGASRRREPCTATSAECCAVQCAFVPGAFPATPPEPADVDAFQADLVYRFDAARRIHGADVVKATLRAAEYLSKKPRRRVLHLEFDLPPDVAYDPGDCLAVPCANSPAVVDAMLRVTGLSGDDVVQVEFLEEPSSTLRWALTYALDLSACPTRDLVDRLARLATDPADAERLRCLSLPDLQHSYTNVVHLLDRYASVRPPASGLVSALSPLSTRCYSIASSPRSHPSTAHIVVAVSEDACTGGPMCTPFQGLCTQWLELCSERFHADLGQQVAIPVLICRSQQLRLPAERLPNLVMIGCGVGVAPFRSFLQHIPHGSTSVFVFMGFRDDDDEYLYRREWARFHGTGAITRLEVAFSRHDHGEYPYRYVQDALRDHAVELRGLLRSSAKFYVCGSIAMANAVFECLTNDVLCGDDLSPSTALQVMQDKIRDGDYMFEAWN